MATFLIPPYCETDAEKLRFIEEITMNAGAVQEQVLTEILSLNAETEYLQRHGLVGATDRGSYKAKIPVVAYEDIWSDIERIDNGNRSPILSAHPISEFNTSSGTSGGKIKLIPCIKEDLNRRIFYCSLIPPIIRKYIPSFDESKDLNFIVLRAKTQTPGGHTASSALTSYYMSLIQNHLWAGISPPAAILCQDYFQCMYIQMLCALYRRLDVLHIKVTFASGLLRSIEFLRRNWPKLVQDISTGTLTDEITDESLRVSVSNLLKTDAQLAGLIAKHCSCADWSGIVPKIWPNAKCLQTLLTGSMSQYVQILQFYGGGLPILSMEYASSECNFGINLRPVCDPREISYTLLPNMAYFEFIPQVGTAELVDLENVEVGKEYELVITTYAGLYRYQVGDILRATGFHNAAPQFQFVRRKSVILSIDADKTNEVELQTAVESAAELIKSSGASVTEYTSYADTKTIPGHYVMYLELFVKDQENFPSNEVMGSCCLAMEEALNAVYRQCRVTDESIGPLEIRVVKDGTFEELTELAVSLGAAVAQFKLPRCVKAGPLVELLDSRVVSAHFSPACPKWSPHQSI